MMAVRERAVKVMAALDRRVPSLDEFVGQSWTAWADWASVTAADGPDVDDCSKNGKKAAEAMSLSKEDMSIFGLYPGHDDFYLVVCSHCGQVVKPQAFEKHCERRHGPQAKLYGKLRSPMPALQHQRPYHGHSPSHGVNPPSASSWEARGPSVGQPRPAPSSPSTPPQYRYPKNAKDGVRLSPLEKSIHSSHKEAAVFKPPPPLEPPVLSPPPSLRDPPWPHGAPPAGRPASSDKPPPQRKDSPQLSAVMGHRVPRPYNKVASKRECDLDKHCGVLDPDRKKVCTRLLTCNIHSIHQRRKVVGRSKNFDQLVAELKMKVREKGAQALDGGFSTGGSPSPEAPREQAGVPNCRRPLASLPAFSRSMAVSECAPEEEKQWQDEAGLRAPSPLLHGHISTDDSEAEAAEELPDFPSSTTHPTPAAVCSFGSHSLGHGIYTFDRRLHHVRSALSSMLEQHISAHLWKKIPQATDLLSPTSSAKSIISSSSVSIATSSSSSSHSKVRAGSHISSSLRNASSSPSRGPGRPLTAPQSENSGGGFAGSGSGSGSGSHPLSLGKPGLGRQVAAGRSRKPVGRPSKQMLKLREEAATAAAFRKRKAPSQEGEHSGPERNCIILQDRGPPPSSYSSSSSKAPSSSLHPHGQTNGTLSPSSKPRPQPPPSESHSPAAKAVWTYKRTLPPLSHASPPDLSPATNSHSRTGVGDSGLLGQGGGGRTFLEHRGLKKRKGGGMEEHPPSSRLSVPRLPSSSSSSGSSSSPRSTFYPWKDSKSGGLDGDMDKKLASQKPKLHH
ncbi:LOW QUALITY PROTEIN: ataxin-7-like protein 2a [Xiphophorus hellerii]|uniref:LOW QUALITY PROTEIN: ataxin-7-like protein 2a n=1 Tax=Xiphophorus hellerii TaxID=8084 RepID=UPI0013B3BCDF|nr:LOW QUALITY PROTEIN: ataxin-7-like protein 2 [Xiphophorus hellerii]